MRLSKEEWKFWAVVALLVSALIVLCALLVWASNRSAIEWKMFVDANDCKIVQEIQGRAVPITTVGWDRDGKLVSSTSTMVESDRITWQCKDGRLYTRNK